MDDNFSPLTGLVTVTMVIDGIPIAIELDGVNAPNTSGNFVDLVEEGFYDGIQFHRVVDDFVIQAGDPSKLSAGTAPKPAVTRTIPLEIRESTSGQYAFGFTFAQAGVPDLVPTLQNRRGTIAMARSGDPSDPALDTPNTASTQFYINLNDRNTFLNGNYAVFGSVTSNLTAIDNVAIGSEITGARVTAGTVPGRTSGFMATGLLNQFANRLGQATLIISAQLLDDTANTIALTSELSTAHPTGVLTLGGNDFVTGSVIGDVVYGGQGADAITGGLGNDLLRGGRDNDILSGGADDDILHGNLGEDTINGGGGSDFIRGGQGNDQINGGAGSDFLISDRGVDTLSGGADADTFLLRIASDLTTDVNALDTITDFSLTEGDRLVIVGEVNGADVGFVASGADALIRIAGGSVLGRVTNGAAIDLASSLSVVSDSDLGVSFG